jgi:hypothetical protein
LGRQQIEAGQGDVWLTALAGQWERHQKAEQDQVPVRHANLMVVKARSLVDNLARQQGITPIRNIDELRFSFPDSESAIDDFLTAVKVSHREEEVTVPLDD